MPLVKVSRSAQITLPVEVRKPLNISEGDYLLAEAVEGGILLKPVAVVERSEAWKQLYEVINRVEDRRPHPRKDPKAEEEEIAAMVKEFKKKNRAKGRT